MMHSDSLTSNQVSTVKVSKYPRYLKALHLTKVLYKLNLRQTNQEHYSDNEMNLLKVRCAVTVITYNSIFESIAGY